MVQTPRPDQQVSAIQRLRFNISAEGNQRAGFAYVLSVAVVALPHLRLDTESNHHGFSAQILAVLLLESGIRVLVAEFCIHTTVGFVSWSQRMLFAEILAEGMVSITQ